MNVSRFFNLSGSSSAIWALHQQSPPQPPPVVEAEGPGVRRRVLEPIDDRTERSGCQLLRPREKGGAGPVKQPWVELRVVVPNNVNRGWHTIKKTPQKKSDCTRQIGMGIK